MIADVDVDGLPTDFVDRRVLVRVPVGTRQAIMVPRAAVTTRSGLDFITLATSDTVAERTVVLGAREGDRIEIVTGLVAGDAVVTP